MITVKITNTRVEGETLVAFYEFSNNIGMTNRFPLTANFVEIMAWGDVKALELVKRDIEIAEMETLLKADPIDVEQKIEAEVLKARSLDELIARKVAERIAIETAVEKKAVI